MMRAELKELHSPDLPGFPAETPPDARNFQLLVEASIGPADSPGADLFSAIVCSAALVGESVPAKGYLWKGRRLLLGEYDQRTIRRAWKELCDETTGDDWKAIALQLSKVVDWEFDAYRPKESAG